jgi:hypothetical protein
MNIRRWARGASVGSVLLIVVAVSACSGSTGPPPPRFGQSVDIGLISGAVIVKPAAGKPFRLGAEDRNIPVGSELDTTLGEVDLRSAVAPGSAAAAPNATRVQDGQFSGALFKILQRKSQQGLTELDLATTRKLLGLCAAGTVAKAARQPLGSRVLQTLRARDSGGRFRTRGRYSAATVRGTSWDTIERCDGTVIVVHRGTVEVFDYGRRRTITVHAGQSYLAKATAGRP